MELVTILLSALLGILAPAGLIADEVAETTLRHQLDQAEELMVRIDNTPSYQILQGRIDRIRIAGRGLYPIEGVRIAALELESDPIALDPDLSKLKLREPLQAAIKVVLTEADLNRALQSEQVADSLDDLNLDFAAGETAERYDVVNPQFEILDNDRIRLRATFQGQQTGEQTPVAAEFGLEVAAGQQFRLIDPVASLGDQPIESRFLSLLLENVSQQFFNRLEDSGITARVLQLNVEDHQLTLASFIRVEPDAVDQFQL